MTPTTSMPPAMPLGDPSPSRSEPAHRALPGNSRDGNSFAERMVAAEHKVREAHSQENSTDTALHPVAKEAESESDIPFIVPAVWILPSATPVIMNPDHLVNSPETDFAQAANARSVEVLPTDIAFDREITYPPSVEPRSFDAEPTAVVLKQSAATRQLLLPEAQLARSENANSGRSEHAVTTLTDPVPSPQAQGSATESEPPHALIHRDIPPALLLAPSTHEHSNTTAVSSHSLRDAQSQTSFEWGDPDLPQSEENFPGLAAMRSVDAPSSPSQPSAPASAPRGTERIVNFESTPTPWTEVVQHIAAEAPSVLQSQGEVELRFRVSPPDLGPIRVRLASSAEGVSAELTVTSEAVQHVLQSRFPELRQQLELAGVHVNAVTVQLHADSFRESRRQSAQARDESNDTLEAPRRRRTATHEALHSFAASGIDLVV